jgi:hypothetical protein
MLCFLARLVYILVSALRLLALLTRGIAKNCISGISEALKKVSVSSILELKNYIQWD